MAVHAPRVTQSLLVDGAATGDRLVVVGERGHILVSLDDGETWKQAAVPVRVLLTAVHMHDSSLGWAVGHDAVILRTVDGGMTWNLVHQAPEEERPLLDVWFRDDRSGFAIGAYGYFLVSADGGETWTSRYISDEDFHLNAMTAGSGGQRLYIAGEAGVLYRSGDGGHNWQKLPSPQTGSWFGVLSLDHDRLIVLGLRGQLFRSEDGGDSWSRIGVPTTATLTSALRLSSGRILITGLEGVVLSLRSDEGPTTRRLSSREGISGALETGDGRVVLIGEFGIRQWSPESLSLQ